MGRRKILDPADSLSRFQDIVFVYECFADERGRNRIGDHVGVAEFTRNGKRGLAIVGEGHLAVTNTAHNRRFFMSLYDEEPSIYDGEDTRLVARGAVEAPYPEDLDRYAGLLNEASCRFFGIKK